MLYFCSSSAHRTNTPTRPIRSKYLPNDITSKMKEMLDAVLGGEAPPALPPAPAAPVRAARAPPGKQKVIRNWHYCHQ